MRSTQDNFARESRFAKSLYGDLSKFVLRALRELIQRHEISVTSGDVKYLNGGWYVTHSGLLRLAERRHCAGIHSRPVLTSSDPATSRWVFRAAVFKSRACRGFVGYGDADPSNVSPLVHGAEMRVAETRAVNRALRKAYGIGICSAGSERPEPAGWVSTRRALCHDVFRAHPAGRRADRTWRGSPQAHQHLDGRFRCEPAGDGNPPARVDERSTGDDQPC